MSVSISLRGIIAQEWSKYSNNSLKQTVAQEDKERTIDRLMRKITRKLQAKKQLLILFLITVIH